jgi:hypothetical protein
LRRARGAEVTPGTSAEGGVVTGAPQVTAPRT